MRNLKKILALALALVMTLSLMTVANAFNDDADIDETYAEAVEVLSGLEVFKGVNDGSNFAPKQTITRAEVAAIIYRIVTGDVDDTQEGIYSDYAKFADVAETHWAAGYIGFCSNAKLIVGDGTNFYPDQTVTGYQALAMILRALGYDQNDEFKGDGWEIRVASTAQQKGILKNINAGTLGTGASREMVAEILFQAIANTNTVYYLTNTMSYRDNDTTLGYETFGLERIEGVVTANEYADLYGAAPLAAGKTELDGTVIDYSSELTDIGESRYAYVVGSEVLALADTGLNEVFETGAATVVNDKNTGMKLSGAEEYINFGGDGDVYESEWRIEFTVTFTDANNSGWAWDEKAQFAEDYGIAEGSLGNETTFTDVIRAGEEITSNDLAIIRGIFAAADDSDKSEGIQGSVYVGTNSTRDDVSDDMSYRAFFNEYIDAVGDSADVTASDNGEWLKVVDNDGDGVAEYVFLTEFAMSKIYDITNKGVYTFASLENDDEPAFAATRVNEADIVTSDELAEGDVVLYTVIDGVYYVDLADMVTETVDRGGVDKADETITCDGTVYEQSHIGYADVLEEYDVTRAHTGETYDLYLDHFGYVRLYEVSRYNRGFVLLTDGYYYTDERDTETFQAEIYDLDAEELTDVDVAVGSDKTHTSADTFIETDRHGDSGTWDRLNEFRQVYYPTAATDPFITNIAAYAVNDGTYTLSEVEYASNAVDYSAVELDVNSNTKLGARTLDTVAGSAKDYVQTNNNTQYYLVVKDSRGIVEVITWVGYGNEPDGAALGDSVDAYAVAHSVGNSVDYRVADVVVFETTEYDPYSLYFVYDANSWDELITIGYDGEEYVAGHEIIVDDQVRYDLVEFYEITSGGVKKAYIGTDETYAENYIYAGEVTVQRGTQSVDYVALRASNNTSDEEISFYTAGDEAVPAFTLTYDGKGYNTADAQVEDFRTGDEVIVVCDRNGNVQYAINVTQSYYDANRNGEQDATDPSIAALDALYDAIWDEYNAVSLKVVNNIDNTIDPAGSDIVYDPDNDEWTITLEPETGYAFDGNLFATVNNEASFQGVVDPTTGVATFTLDRVDKDDTVVLSGNTKAIEYKIEYAIATTDTSKTDDTAPADTTFTVENIDDVTLATVEGKDGWVFNGWLDADGNEVTADTLELKNYEVTADFVTEAIRVNAKIMRNNAVIATPSVVVDSDEEAAFEITSLVTYSVNGVDQGYAGIGGETTDLTIDVSDYTAVNGVIEVVVEYVEEVDVIITGTDSLNWSASSSGKVDPTNPSLEVTMTQKTGSGLSKNGTLILKYTVDGVSKQVEGTGTQNSKTATFTLTELGSIDGPVTIVISENLSWKA